MRVAARSLVATSVCASLAGVAMLVVASCAGGDQTPPKPASIADASLDVPLDVDDGSTPPSSLPPSSPRGDLLAPAPPFLASPTPLVRVDGDRLFLLHAERGLLAFDNRDVDHPRLLGRVPMAGMPVALEVKDGVAVAVVTDFYGTDAGKPIYGSLVRTVDVKDASHLRVLGEAKLDRWVRRAMLLGELLYVATQGPTWLPLSGGKALGNPFFTVESLRVSGATVAPIDRKTFDTPLAEVAMDPRGIVVATSVPQDPAKPFGVQSPKTDLQFLDISNASGTLVAHGAARVQGRPNDGLFGDDFPLLSFDGTFARAIGCMSAACASDSTYVLATVDFTLIDTPSVTHELPLPAFGERPFVRFSRDRIFLSPTPTDTGAPSLLVYDVKTPSVARFAGSFATAGGVLDARAIGGSLLVLSRVGDVDEKRTLEDFDLSDPKAGKRLDLATFERSTSAAGALGVDRLVVDEPTSTVALPWATATDGGVRLFGVGSAGFSGQSSISTGAPSANAAFVRSRVVALRPGALELVDASAGVATAKHTGTSVVARDVVSIRASSSNVLELSTEGVRTLDPADVEELSTAASSPTVPFEGRAPLVFRNGSLAYVITVVDRPTKPTQQLAVVDLSATPPKVRGTLKLPGSSELEGNRTLSPAGIADGEWFDGAPIVQVAPTLLAVRRFTGGASYGKETDDLFLIDLERPDAPTFSSLRIGVDPSWWGQMFVAHGALYLTHAEALATAGAVRFVLDAIDVADRASPKIAHQTPFPGVAFAGADDASIFYGIDVHPGVSGGVAEELTIARNDGGGFTTLSRLSIGGRIGRPIVAGSTLYASVVVAGAIPLQVHAYDLHDASAPRDRLVVGALRNPGGFLLDVRGERFAVESVWGSVGVDVFAGGGPDGPIYDHFVRTDPRVTPTDDAVGADFVFAAGLYGASR